MNADIISIDATRADRLFVSHLGSARIPLLWLAFLGKPPWICIVLAILVFRWA